MFPLGSLHTHCTLKCTLMVPSIQHFYIFANNDLPKHGFFFTILTLGWTITIDVPFLGMYGIRVVMNLSISTACFSHIPRVD
jgi:hypothetical protein